MMSTGRLSITPRRKQPTTPSRTSILSRGGTPTSRSSSSSRGRSFHNDTPTNAAAAARRNSNSNSNSSRGRGRAASPATSTASATSSVTTTVNAMTTEDFERLNSLMAWLQTFAQYDYEQQPPITIAMTPVELLSQVPVATIVLRITEEILDRELAAPASATVQSIWAQVFSTLSSPKLLQKFAGRRLGSTELRFVLLSALLSTSVHPTCDARITYINRIMTLPKATQHSLMTLIESFPKTPNKSPGRYASPARTVAVTNVSATSGIRSGSDLRHGTPGRRSAASRLHRTPTSWHSFDERSNSSVAETPRSSGSRRHFSTQQQQQQQQQPTSSSSKFKQLFPEEPDLLALMGWIRTFPQLHGLGSLSQLQMLNDVKVSLAILHVAEHVCDQLPSPPAYSSSADTWAAMDNVFSRATPPVSVMGGNLKNMTMEERQLARLSGLLCYAVSDSSIDRKAHVSMILSLPRDMQKRLMTIIEAPMAGSDRTVSSITESNLSRRSREDDPSGFTPARKRRSPNANANDDDNMALFSPAIGLDRMVQELKEQNHQLQKQLQGSTSREADLTLRMQNLESKVRRDMMRIESGHLRKADEVYEAHDQELTKLRDELFLLQSVRSKEEVAQRELASLKDDMDVMEHTKEKLAETEEKWRKCKERLELLVDVKESLKREEEAHSASVTESLRLNNELQSLQPLRRQLEEYKARTIDAEFQLVTVQQELKEVRTTSANMTNTHTDLVEGARMQQEEADGLRFKLSMNDTEGIEVGLGDGISELNPQVKEELLKLRNENAQLQEFRAKRDADGVQRLEEQLDDIQRLSDRFKEQFLSTKKDLESTTAELETCRGSEESLQAEVAVWIAKWEIMEQKVEELEELLENCKQELANTMTLLEDSEQREQELVTDMETLTREKEDVVVESEQRMIDLTSTKKELSDTTELLVQSQDREKELHAEIENGEETVQEEQQRSAGFENELNLTAEELETTKVELNGRIDHENTMRIRLADLMEAKTIVDQELVDEKRSREADNVVTTKTSLETIDGLKAESKKELEDLQSNMNMLLENERIASKNKLQESKNDYQDLFEKSTAEYGELQSKSCMSLEATKSAFESHLTRLKEEHNTDIEAIKSQADVERNKIIHKGRAMMKDTKRKAEEIIRELEEEVHETKDTMLTLRTEKDEFEHKTRAKVTSYKHKLQFTSSKISALSEENNQLTDTVHDVEKEKAKVLEENERYRRQLGGRYGADGKNQNQMDMLQKEFNAILEENRNLKRKLASGGSSSILGAISEGKDENDYGETTTGKPYARGGVNGSTLSALREEYEEQIQSLNDEKRELVMRNSAAITDVQKAEQRAWELEKDMERLKEELTSSHLALQRAELQAGNDTGTVVDRSFLSAREESFHSAKDSDENKKHYTDTIMVNERPSDELLDIENASPLLVDLQEFSVISETPTRVLSPSNCLNTTASSSERSGKKTVAFRRDPIKPLSRSTSDVINTSVTSLEGPSLMELTQQRSSGQDTVPDCQQS